MMETHVAVAVRGSHHLTTAIMLKLKKYVVIIILSLLVLNQKLSIQVFRMIHLPYISYQEENKVVSERVRIRLCLTKFIFHCPFL